MLRGSLFALSLLTAFIAPAYATGLQAEQIVEVATVSVDENGQEQVTYTLAEEVAPGDQVRYTINYTNAGNESASNVKLDMPVPAEVDFIEGSADATSAEISYSADNGETFASRGTLTVTEAGEPQAATAKDITHVRWTFTGDIAPGEAGNISYSGVLQ
jgi:uncharacterized repeat protein (TIGR01451 family)